MKEWDAFVSHASEDKASVALPLCHALRQAGVRVWLDACELRVGDSVRGKIDEGLARSRYGVVIASTTFFRKDWASAELDALFGIGHVLPVLHRLDVTTLKTLSPLLAGKSCLSTELGLNGVAVALAERIFSSNRAGAPEAHAFAKHLAACPQAAPSADSLRTTLSTALSLDRKDLVITSAEIDGHPVALCIARFQESSWRHEDWTLVLAGAPGAALFRDDGSRAQPLSVLLDRAANIRAWIQMNFAEARSRFPGIKLDYSTLVVLGRRAQPGSPAVRLLANLNDSLLGCRVRTYDWILDALVAEGHNDR
jgi:hypothetical protein